MTNQKTVVSLFEKEPIQWGLRGDPYLWQAMQHYFAQTPLPATVAELTDLLNTAFESLTSHPILTTRPFFIEQFSHSGMSSGQISPAFWREKAIPLLLARYGQL